MIERQLKDKEVEVAAAPESRDELSEMVGNTRVKARTDRDYDLELEKYI